MVKIGYVRVSRESQDPTSQIALMRNMGIIESDIFVDHGISGWTEPLTRAKYKDMMKRVAAGGVDTIVFSEFSRLGRDAKESLFELLRLEHEGIAIQSLSNIESFINSIPPTFQPQILAGMMCGADLERKHHKERTQWAIDNIKSTGGIGKSGKPIGRPSIPIDWDKIDSVSKKYNVSENVARKICGYGSTTFYKYKKYKGGSHGS
jgi:DNA invertase Pin-like site-specific DNA recombinase